MTTVLDSPVTTHSVGKLFHLDRQTADEIAHLCGLFSIADAPQKCDPDREQSLPVIEPRQALGSGHLKIGSPLDPAVLLLRGVQSTSTDPAEVSLRLFVDPGLFTRPSRLVEAREDEGLAATEMVIGGASTGSRAHRPLSPRPRFRVVAQFKAAASSDDGRERAAAPRRDAMDRAVFSIAWEAASVAGKPVPSPTTA